MQQWMSFKWNHTEMKPIELDLCRPAPLRWRNTMKRRMKTVLQVKYPKMDMHSSYAWTHRLLNGVCDALRPLNRPIDVILIAQSYLCAVSQCVYVLNTLSVLIGLYFLMLSLSHHNSSQNSSQFAQLLFSIPWHMYFTCNKRVQWTFLPTFVFFTIPFTFSLMWNYHSILLIYLQ